MALLETLDEMWRSRLALDCPDQAATTQVSIIKWLLGEDPERLNSLEATQLTLAQQAMDYRYRILLQRYLHATPEQAYQRLMRRLASLFLVRSKIKTWVDQSRDRQRSVMDVLGEVLQEMLQGDRQLQQQMLWINQCTHSTRLRNLLLLTSLEEYCLRPIRNQPLLVYRFVNFLNRVERGGMTQVPAKELIRLISEEITPEDEDSSLSLFDNEAVTQYQSEQEWQELQLERHVVQQEFEQYLAEELGTDAVKWLRLYLQGQSQEAIAQHLALPIKQIYRLREKINYHAVRVFALKVRPELVSDWLGISLKQHKLGLTAQKWQTYWEELTPQQQVILQQMQEGTAVADIAKTLKLKTSQVMGEWGKLYLVAQALRNATE
jgi:DNA-binding CsgD family transcriptional regulator